MMQSYPIEVFWNDEDQIWIADVRDLPFCSGHGPTPHEAVQEAEIGVEAWLAAARAEGREVPVPSRRSIRA
jgi:predicted RNase H-like HicB family nuclease